MACLFGHKWNGCVCEKCGKMRNEQHRFEDGKCVRCGKTIAEIIAADLPKAQWVMSGDSSSRYYKTNAPSLCFASEMLSKLTDIPPMTYYMVDTPNGTIGRDIVGYFTSGPIRTKGLATQYRTYGINGAAEAISLIDYGDMMKTNSTTAALKANGQYAKLILMMKCGHCGYESPVETDAGDMERECYFCGTNNKTSRGKINVFTQWGLIEL